MPALGRSTWRAWACHPRRSCHAPVHRHNTCRMYPARGIEVMIGPPGEREVHVVNCSAMIVAIVGFILAGEPAVRPVDAAVGQTPATTTGPAGGNANGQRGSARLVANIDVKDFGAETLRIGDLDGDGELDLLLVQSVYATRKITCLTALTIGGRVLWQVGRGSGSAGESVGGTAGSHSAGEGTGGTGGSESAGGGTGGTGRIYSDLPVQVYDWDDDGRNEVLYVRQARYIQPGWDGKSPLERAERYEGAATMVVLDGTTGREKQTFALPAPADDSFLFANLTGGTRRGDLVVKDRYWQAWGISHEGRELWHYAGSVGHYPAIADIDGDGRDEVFFGFALVDHDGKVLFQHDARGEHQDACWIMQMHDGDFQHPGERGRSHGSVRFRRGPRQLSPRRAGPQRLNPLWDNREWRSVRLRHGFQHPADRRHAHRPVQF